jgi:hypothetical protein
MEYIYRYFKIFNFIIILVTFFASGFIIYSIINSLIIYPDGYRAEQEIYYLILFILYCISIFIKKFYFQINSVIITSFLISAIISSAIHRYYNYRQIKTFDFNDFGYILSAFGIDAIAILLLTLIIFIKVFEIKKYIEN